MINDIIQTGCEVVRDDEIILTFKKKDSYFGSYVYITQKALDEMEDIIEIAVRRVDMTIENAVKKGKAS